MILINSIRKFVYCSNTEKSTLGNKKYLLITLFITLLCSCTYKIDEKIFYSGNGIQLKVATYYENLPLHFNGNVFRIQCRSAKTDNIIATKMNDATWTEYLPIASDFFKLGYTSESKMDLNRISAVAMKKYHITDYETIITESNKAVAVSFNGCKSFQSWSLDTLPHSEMIDSTPEFVECVNNTKKSMSWSHVKASVEKKGSIEEVCKLSKLEGIHLPFFSEFIASRDGKAHFRIESSGFKSIKAIIVETSDFGKTWIQKIIKK